MIQLEKLKKLIETGTGMEVLQVLFDSDGFYSVSKALEREIGTIYATYFCKFASKYNYYKKENKLYKDEWFFWTDKAIEEETKIKRSMRENIVNELINLGLIEKKRMNTHGITYYRIDFIKAYEYIAEFEKKKEEKEKSEDLCLSKSDNDDCQKPTMKNVKNEQTYLSESNTDDCQNSTPSNNILKDNKENNNQSYQSIIKNDEKRYDEMYSSFLKNIEFDSIKAELGNKKSSIDILDDILNIIEEVYHCDDTYLFSIGGINYTKDMILNRFNKLKCEHIVYIIGCLKENATEIKNIKNYVLKTLMNSINTINIYYNNQVNSGFRKDLEKKKEEENKQYANSFYESINNNFM